MPNAAIGSGQRRLDCTTCLAQLGGDMLEIGNPRSQALPRRITSAGTGPSRPSSAWPAGAHAPSRVHACPSSKHAASCLGPSAEAASKRSIRGHLSGQQPPVLTLSSNFAPDLAEPLAEPTSARTTPSPPGSSRLRCPSIGLPTTQRAGCTPYRRESRVRRCS